MKKTNKPQILTNVDIRKIKDFNTVREIINKSLDSYTEINLFDFAHDSEVMKTILKEQIDIWIKDGNISTNIKAFKGINDYEIKDIVGKGFLNFISNLKCPSGYRRFYGQEVAKEIGACVNYFNKEDKPKIISKAVEKQDLFYPYAKKHLCSSLLGLASTDNEIILVLSSFYKVLNNKLLAQAIDSLTDGEKNKELRKILDKAKRFSVCKYSKDDLSDKDKRIALIKDIGRTPTSTKNLRFDINITVDDLKHMAPVMRLKFLEWCFDDLFRHMRYNYNYSWVLKRIKAYKFNKIKIDLLSENDLRELLFTVGIKKNSRATKFIENYNKYRDKIEEFNKSL